MKKFLLTALVVVGLFAWAWGANVTTLGDLRQDVKNNFLVMTDALFPDSVLDDFINQACRDISGYGVITDVDSIIWVANTKNYALPEDFISYIAIYPDAYSGAKAFDYIHPSAVGKIAAATDLTASRYVWITGKNSPSDVTSRIWFYPAPSAVDTLELTYAREATELSASTDTCDIPYQFRTLIPFHVTASCFAKAQEYQKSAWWFALYDQTLNKKLLFQQQKYDYILIPREIKQ